MDSSFNDEVVANVMVTNSSENREQISPMSDSKQQSTADNNLQQETEMQSPSIKVCNQPHPLTVNNDKATLENEQTKPARHSAHRHENHNLEIHRIDQSHDNGLVFLPRLAGSSVRTCHDMKHASGNGIQDNKSVDTNGNQFHLPDIHVVCARTSRLALQRSITDLLDPEMEILNKIKRGSKKKKRKRKIQAFKNDDMVDDVF